MRNGTFVGDEKLGIQQFANDLGVVESCLITAQIFTEDAGVADAELFGHEANHHLGYIGGVIQQDASELQGDRLDGHAQSVVGFMLGQNQLSIFCTQAEVIEEFLGAGVGGELVVPGNVFVAEKLKRHR